MNKLFFTLLLLAVALLLSCTSIERDSVCDEKSIYYNGCVGGVPPSPSVTYEGETYQTVVIGEQVWLARNLNYAAPGKCGGDYNNLKDENTKYCDAYGRLYDWATAMALPEECNSEFFSCTSQIKAKHQGICPSGWHIPNKDDWDNLVDYVESNNDCNNCAAKYLKATSGWNDNGNGQDTYGFSALPGGLAYVSIGFRIGDGRWWSASEIYQFAVNLYMRSDNEGVGSSGIEKNYLLSVRCVKD